ncbi:hypothetical protein [Lactococcus lactis]|uniref:Uncharacterized protein n=1 Tax=Lactococcus lactis TaxID=1358 RepID=A0AAW5TJB1_9LACT|nr:hypothetical protein [Lactococcus lactis]MCW2281209.1 hypothetical protein [Lactococcus lactis]
MLGWRKNYRFEFSQADNIKEREIKHPSQLVNFIIGENQELMALNETGSIVISKIESSKKGEQILFAQRLVLPMSPQTDFDALLQPFYTKHPLDFDEGILESQEASFQVLQDSSPQLRSSEASDSMTPPSFYCEEEKGDYAPAPTIDLSDEQPEPQEALRRDQEVNIDAEEGHKIEKQSEETSASGHSEINVPTSTLLTEESVKAIVAKALEEKERQEELSKDEALTSESVSAEPFSSSEASADFLEDANVNEVIQRVKTEANQRLNAFIAQETAKINAEIERLDGREAIESTLSQRFEKEKAAQSEAIIQKIATEKAEALTQENARHERAVQSIEKKYETEQIHQLKTLQEETANQLSLAIKEEYERQTKQLHLILQGKMEELQLRQKAVNEGMKTTVAEVLEGFNRNHEAVIQRVERRKNSKDVISLHQRVG